MLIIGDMYHQFKTAKTPKSLKINLIKNTPFLVNSEKLTEN